jgi:predicted Zn-dependent peptidase
MDWKIDYDFFNLSNGIRLITVRKVFQPFITIRVYVKNSILLNGSQPGLAHFVEHMIFRGYQPGSKDNIYREIEALGGKIEGNTSREYSDYSLIILKENVEQGLEILADMLTQPAFTAEDIEAEREIIAEEINHSYSRSKMLWDLFAGAIWEQSPFTVPITGTHESISQITVKEVADFYTRCFIGENMVISIIGDIDGVGIAKTIENRFAAIPRGPLNAHRPTVTHTFSKKKTVHIPRESIQSHLVLGYPGVGIQHADIHAFKLINKIVGHGLSSRLYQRLKVSSHLVYSLSSVLSVYEDTGYFAIWTIFSDSKAKTILEVISDEMQRLLHEKIPGQELDNAKIRYKRDFLMTFDSDLSAAGYLASTELLTGNIETVNHTIECINDINRQRLIKLAQHYFQDKNRCMVLIGKTL